MARVGLALKGLQWCLRAIEFCCAATILAIFSYFLATLKNHGLEIDDWVRSVEGISGAAVLYALIGLLLLCFVARRAVFSMMAILLDLAFVGAFIYVAYATKSRAGSCSGTVDTVFGTGGANTDHTVPAPNGGVTILPSFKQACELEAACSIVSIIAIVFFLGSAFVEIALWRHHRRERAFGPSPANDYTSGSAARGRFWRRKRGNKALDAAEKYNLSSFLATSPPGDARASYNTENTAVATEPAYHTNGADGYARTNSGYRSESYGATGVGNTGHPEIPDAQYPANSF